MGRLRSVRRIEEADVCGYRIEAAFLTFIDHHGRSCEVYAERCLIGGPHAPGIVHCPGGGQTVNRADLLDWARKGFSVVSFDWQIGDFPAHDPARKSRWPGVVAGQNQFIEEEREAILPLAVQAAGACIDWIINSRQMDPEKIGVTGISWGGYLSWLIAAYEPRVKAAVPVYGCGGHFDDRHPDRLKLVQKVAQLWKENWDPFSIARRQTKPICYLSCTNDFFGILPLADELLNRLKVPHRRGWMPNCNHSISPAESALGLAWFKQFLDGGGPVPAEPVLQDDLTIRADRPEEIASTELWWTRNLKRGDLGCWIQGTPDRPAAAVYGRVHYKQGYALSTPLKFNPSLSSARSTNRSILDGLGWHWAMGSTQFHSNEVKTQDSGNGTIRLTRDPGRQDDAPSFFFNQFADPDWNTGEQDSVSLGLRTEPHGPLLEATVTLTFYGTDNPKEFSARLPIENDHLVLDLRRIPDLGPTHTWHKLARVHIQLKTTASCFRVGPLVKNLS